MGEYKYPSVTLFLPSTLLLVPPLGDNTQKASSHRLSPNNPDFQFSASTVNGAEMDPEEQIKSIEQSFKCSRVIQESNLNLPDPMWTYPHGKG